MEFQENSTPIQHYKYMYKYQTNVVGKVHVEEVVEVISDIYLNRGSREFLFLKTHSIPSNFRPNRSCPRDFSAV